MSALGLTSRIALSTSMLDSKLTVVEQLPEFVST